MFNLILNNPINYVTYLEYIKNYFLFYFYFLFILLTKYFVTPSTYYDRIYHLIRLGGPIFIKIGQNLANKKDIDSNLKNKLIKLQNQNFYKSTFDVKLLKINYNIDELDENPIASGSIASIFKGTFKKNKCIVKKVHKNIVKNTIISINLFEGLRNKIIGNGILSNFNQLVDIKQVYKEVLDQTDLNNETNNLNNIKNNFNNREFSDLIIFPEVYYNDKEVIIESFEEGYSIMEFTKKYPNRKKEASHLIHCVFYKMFFDNCIHADMHFSNVRFTIINDKVKIILYDFGLITSITNLDHYKTFINVYKKNMFIPDKERFIEMLIQFNKNKDANVENFRKECDKLSDKITNPKVYIENPNIKYKNTTTDLIKEALDIALKNNFKICDYAFNICNGFILLDDYNLYISDDKSLLKERFEYAKNHGFIEDMKKSAKKIFKKKPTVIEMNQIKNKEKQMLIHQKERI